MDPREQAHSFKEGETAVSRLAFDFPPMFQRFGQLVPIDLHPLAAQQNQSALGAEDLLEFLFIERLTIQHRPHREIEQRIDAQSPFQVLADLHTHGRPWRMRGLPPIGHADDQAAGLKHRNGLQELVGLPGRPGQRLIDPA